MPTYDYRCEACGHAFEHFQSMSSRRLRTCPVCKEKKLVRLVGAGAGLIFKGSGFYETDYKRGASPKPSESTGDGAGKDTSSPSGGSDGGSDGGSKGDAASSGGGSSGSGGDDKS